MKIICDNCCNYYEHPMGCTKVCYKHIEFEQSSNMDTDYIEDRMNGNKKTCKGYESLGRDNEYFKVRK